MQIEARPPRGAPGSFDELDQAIGAVRCVQQGATGVVFPRRFDSPFEFVPIQGFGRGRAPTEKRPAVAGLRCPARPAVRALRSPPEQP